MNIKYYSLGTKSDFFQEVFKRPNIWLAIFLCFLIALLESGGVFALSVLLTSFTGNINASIWDILPYGAILKNYTFTISITSLQIFICLFLLLRYVAVIIFYHLQFVIIYNLRFIMSQKVLYIYGQKATAGKSDDQSQSKFLRNYINGIDHIADNGLIASLFLIKEFATIAMITYLLIGQFEIRVTFVIPVLGFFLLFGYVMSRWIKGLGHKLADISLLIYSKATDFSRMANYLSYSNRLSYFEKDLNRARYEQISTLKRYGILQISVQPLIELFFVVFIMSYLLFFNSINTSIDDISLALIAMVRLIPAGSRISSGINSLNYTVPYLNEIFESNNKVAVEKIISLKNCGEISVSFPQFKYKQKIITREKLSVSFKPGEVIRLDGASGSGKTSLLNLIASSSSQSDVVVGYVEQFPNFFEGSIYDNLTLQKETIDRTEVVKLCGLLELEKSFGCSDEEIFKIWLSDNGDNLSGGQRKKLALIREKLKRPQLALFDELNAGLDKKSIKISHKFQIEQFSGIPTIFTTHTEDEIVNSDRSLLLSNGYLKEI